MVDTGAPRFTVGVPPSDLTDAPRTASGLASPRGLLVLEPGPAQILLIRAEDEAVALPGAPGLLFQQKWIDAGWVTKANAPEKRATKAAPPKRAG